MVFSPSSRSKRSRPKRFDPFLRFTFGQKCALVGIILTTGLLVVPFAMCIEATKKVKQAPFAVKRWVVNFKKDAEERTRKEKERIERMKTITCDICCEETRGDLFTMNPNCAGRIKCCNLCWKRYLHSDAEEKALEYIRSVKFGAKRYDPDYVKPSLNLKCLCGCDSILPSTLLSRFAPPIILKASSDVALRESLIKKVSQRQVQVSVNILECPNVNCPGVAYDDHVSDKAMCFVCLEAWEITRPSIVGTIVKPVVDLLKRFRDRNIERDLRKGIEGERWRHCPHCNMVTIKNGGCNHMKCGFCRRSYNWKNSIW